MRLDEWLCFGIPDEVMEQASAWLARLDADHVSLAERQRLSAWLDKDPLHRWAFEELSQLYARVATLGPVRGQIDAPKVLIFPSPQTSPQQVSAADLGTSAANRHQWYFVVALLLILVGLGFATRGPANGPIEHAPLEQPHRFEQFLINGE